METTFKTLNFRSEKFFGGGIEKVKHMMPILKEISFFYGFDPLLERKVNVLDEENFTKFEVQFKHKFKETGYVFLVKSLNNYDCIQVYTNMPYVHLCGLLSNLKYYADEVAILTDDDLNSDGIGEYIDKLEDAFNKKDCSLFNAIDDIKTEK